MNEPTRMQEIFNAGKIHSIRTEYFFAPPHYPVAEIDVDATMDGPTWIKISLVYVRMDVSGDAIDMGGFVHDGDTVLYKDMQFFYNLRRNGYRLAQ